MITQLDHAARAGLQKASKVKDSSSVAVLASAPMPNDPACVRLENAWAHVWAFLCKMAWSEIEGYI